MFIFMIVLFFIGVSGLIYTSKYANSKGLKNAKSPANIIARIFFLLLILLSTIYIVATLILIGGV